MTVGQFFKAIGSAIAKVFTLFRSDAVRRDLEKAANMVAAALPYIAVAGQVVAGITPTVIDDAALAAIRLKFPRLFDGSIKSGDELKLYALAVATELLRLKFPDISTSIARLAVQMGYTASVAQ
jgi:hypothetical protein